MKEIIKVVTYSFILPILITWALLGVWQQSEKDDRLSDSGGGFNLSTMNY